MSTEVNAQNKRQLALILAIPVLVVGLSSLYFFLAQKQLINVGTVNLGTLIQPPLEMPKLAPK